MSDRLSRSLIYHLAVGHRLIELLSGWSVERRGLILILSGLVAAVFAAGLPRLKVDSSPDALVSTVAGQEQVKAEFRKVFPGSDTQLLVVVQAPDVTGLEEIRYQHRLSRRLVSEPGIARLDSLTRVALAPARSETKLEEAHVRQPAGALAQPDEWGEKISSAQHQTFLTRLERTPWVVPLLVSEDRKTAALIAHFDEAVVVDQPTRMALLARLRAVVQAEQCPPNLHVTLGGVPVLGEAILNKLEKDQLTLNPAMMLICLLVLGLTFRWWPAVVGPICAVGISALMVIGGMAYLGVPLTILTNIIPPLLIIVGLSDSVHLIGRYQEELLLEPDRVAAGRRAARAMLVACFLTSLTTAVGFGSLAMAKTPELGRFGIAAASGVIVAYFSTVLFVPAFVTKMRPPPRRGGDAGQVGRIEQLVFRLTRSVLRHAKLVVAFAVVATAVLAWGATRVTVDARLLDAFDEREEVTRTTRLIEEELSGIRPLEIMITADEGSVLEPDLIQHVEAVAAWARAEEDVIAAVTYAAPLRGAREALTSDPEVHRRPFRSLGQVQALKKVLQLGASDPLNQWISPDEKTARMTVFFADAGIRRTLLLLSQLEKRLGADDAKGLHVAFLGEAYTGSVGRDHVLRDLTAGLGLALVSIFLLLGLLFRSVRLGLVAMPPNVIPLLATGAYMMARGIHLNMATVITFSIGIGLAVDDTVHVVARFREEQRRISSVGVALLRAARGTGRAIVVTALSLSLGFSVLMLSEFVSVRQFGELISVTVINCLISALVIQPALLYLVTKKPKRRRI